MIFRKCGRPSANEVWNFNGEPFRIVGDYKYLGAQAPTISNSKNISLKIDAAKLS